MLAHEDRRNQTRAQLNTDYSDRLLESEIVPDGSTGASIWNVNLYKQ
jgi:hypothetical protein